MNAGGSLRVISEGFYKAKCSSKKTFYMGSFELAMMSRLYLQSGLLFRTQDGDGAPVIKPEYLEKLKRSFQTTLDHFYPLTGQFERVVEEEIQKSSISVDCNKGPGAKLIHAALDDVTATSDAIASSTYVPAIVQSFFDLGRVRRNCDAFDVPILVAQVTELVDGVFLSVSVNHCVADGTTLWHFLSSWSEIFLSEEEEDDDDTISRPPICERWFPEGHGPMLKIPNIRLHELVAKINGIGERNETLAEAIFYLPSQSVALLKEKANAECGMVDKISSFQALSAAIWRFIVRARRQRQYEEEEDSICIIPANGRARMVPPLSQDYIGSFGVVFLIKNKVSELVDESTSLGEVALSIHHKVQELTFEHLRDSFVGWANSPYFAPVGMHSSNNVVISGVPREDVYNAVEFGFGKPISVLCGSINEDGKVVIHAGKDARGSVTLQVCLSLDAMLALQQDQEFVSLLSSYSTFNSS